ncbi:MAG: alpha-amylase family glycosyl hydrolase, partial [Candidatus Onthovivens sp.]|nr:alpha-amylase family glycosyl hydrolase [Candidatus Onthovivens sp.]
MKSIQFKTLTLVGALLASISLSSCSKKSAIIINDVDTTEAVLNDNYRNFYEIFVASYQDSDGDHVGDLNGVTSKLDYIKDLGYNGIWLMPINVSPTYHKYDVADYYTIDSSYGTLQDLENLITECHERDIKIIMDLVINHSSTNNNMFKYACSA